MEYQAHELSVMAIEIHHVAPSIGAACCSGCVSQGLGGGWRSQWAVRWESSGSASFRRGFKKMQLKD